MEQISFNVISYADKNFNPHSVERLINRTFDCVFTLGDYVTNGTKMKGRITKFTLSEDLTTLFVYTDWSNVGMELASIYKIMELPSRFQLNDEVSVRFRPDFVINHAKVIKVHFTENKVQYDLEVKINIEGNPNYPSGHTTSRIYNIDSEIVGAL